MNEDEVESTIAEMQRLFEQHGFVWARQEAEASLTPESTRRELALALLSALKSVTVDLAQSELSIYDELKVDNISFQPDVDQGLTDPDLVQSENRRKMLEQLVELDRDITNLRAELDGDQ